MATKPVLWNGTDAQGQPLRWNSPSFVWNGTIQLDPNPSTHMPHLRVSLAFAHETDHSLEETSGHVSAGLYAEAAYNDPAATPPLIPPVAQADLDAATLTFHNAVLAQAQSGTEATADKHNKREILVGLLRKLASHVQGRHGDDLAVLLSSGFEAVATAHTPATLAAPTIRDIHQGGSGLVVIRVDPMSNIRTWRVRYFVVGPGGTLGPEQDGGLHGDSRHIRVDSLTPGTNYSFEVQAVASGELHSDWSHAVNCMSL